jgi:hypothetical protein
MTTQQNEQQVDGGAGGQTGAFSEQAGAGLFGGPQQNEQQVDGGGHDGGGQTGAFSEQAAPVHEVPVIEPLHVPSEEPSYEDAGHAAADGDPSGLAGGTDSGPEVHHA